MLKKSLLFFFFTVFFMANGFSQQTKSDSQLLNEIRNIINGEDGVLKPLTWDDVRTIPEGDRKETFEELEYYLSTDINLTFRPKKTRANSGKLEIDYGDTETKKIISKTSKGKFKEYNDKEPNKEYFEIKFSDYTVKFNRNIQTGRFDNHEVYSAPDTKAVCEGSLPYLCVFFVEKGVMKPQDNSLNQKSQAQALPQIQTQRYNTAQIHSGLSRENQIMGRGTLSRDVIVSYISSRNPNSLMTRQEIYALVSEYINEAIREGVNHDIAIAQMCYATGFLSNRQILNTYNYGGLNTDIGISVRHGYRHAYMQEGVWAHIQHLKGYASCERPKRDIVDQRYYLLVNRGIQGTVITLDDLFATWAPNNYIYYGNTIRRILNEMYQLSGRFI
ncbi:MAG: glucosaminidase domain-containing protein [Treponema sp.]|nr:glucosaminidase domain-containing protein [Treponema sp.]